MRIVAVSLGALFAMLFFLSYGNAALDTTTQSRHDATSSVRTGPIFYGKVDRLNESSEVLTIKGRNGVVAFDISNPILMGYRSINDIKVGDFIGVQYTRNGIRILKKGSEIKNMPLEAETAGKSRPVHEQPVTTMQNNMKKKPKAVKRFNKSNNEIKVFGDIDVNKDGKLSPIELSTMIRELTMAKFRQYDKNGNGYLDKKEFVDILRTEVERKSE
jgi:hypothetical protein